MEEISKESLLPLETITGEMGEVIVRGQVMEVEARETVMKKQFLSSRSQTLRTVLL